MKFFGPPWGRGARVATPDGIACLHCKEEIQKGERGVLMPGHLEEPDEPPMQVAYHRECILRSIFGSPAHLLGTCRCRGGGEPENGAPSISIRDEARESERILDERGPGGVFGTG